MGKVIQACANCGGEIQSDREKRVELTIFSYTENVNQTRYFCRTYCAWRWLEPIAKKIMSKEAWEKIVHES